MNIPANNIYRLKYFNYCLITILIIGVSVFFLTFTSNDQVAGMFSDDAMYLLQAELYSPWHLKESPVIDLIRKESRFPPLYPIILGSLGVNSQQIILAAQISCVILLLSIFIYGLWVWHESKNISLIFIAVTTLSFLPSTLIMSQGLWSEFLFMIFIYSAFLCSESRINSHQKFLATALLIALSTLTRSIGISFAAAFILMLSLKRTNNRLVYIVVSILPFLLWTLIRNILQEHPSYFDDLLATSSYISTQELLNILSTRFTILAESWIWLFSIIDSYIYSRSLTYTLATILFLFAIFGFFIRVKQLKLDALSIPFYIAIIMIWPYQNVYFVSRFLYPLLPVFLFYMWLGIQSFPINKKYLNIIIALWVMSIIVIAYPSSNQFIERGYKEVSPDLMPYRRSRHWLLEPEHSYAELVISFNKHLIETLPKISKHISEKECIYAYQAPIIILYTHRITSVFPPYTESTAEFEQQTKACNLFLAMNITDLNSAFPPFYPMQHIKDDDKYEIQAFHDKSTKNMARNILLIRRLKE